MKTKEFIKIMEDEGFRVDVVYNDIIIRKKVGHAYLSLAIVSETKRFSLGTKYHTFDGQSTKVKAFILDNLYKYTSTPISERESIELLPAERVILESISHEYKGIKLNDDGVLTLENFIGLEYEFCMFGRLFDWVKSNETYELYDLLND